MSKHYFGGLFRKKLKRNQEEQKEDISDVVDTVTLQDLVDWQASL